MSQITVAEGAAPGTPAAGKVTIYAKADGAMYQKDDAGTETAMSGASAIPKAQFTAADEIIVGTGAGTYSQVTLAASQFLAKKAAGNVTNVTAAEVMAILSAACAAAFSFNDQTVSKANFLDCGIVTNAIGSIGGGAQTIDLTLGNSVSATVDTGETTFTFSNPTASDELCVFTLILTNGGSQTVNWPASVDWAGGTAPTLTSSGVDILVFATIDGGTTWHGSTFVLDSQ